MSGRKLALTFALLLAFVVICYGASPYVSFWRFHEALRTGDRDAVASHVDFPALRDSLKHELHARFFPDSSTDKKKKKGWRAMLENAAPSLIDTLVDAYVTPDGIVALLADPRIAVAQKQPPNPSEAAPVAEHNFDWSNLQRAFFTGPRDFVVDAKQTKLYFRFSLSGWRLRAIDLPPDVKA
jgi:hypothetical protein